MPRMICVERGPFLLLSQREDVNYRAILACGWACLLVGLVGPQARAADAQSAGPKDQATIYFSSAPWDGAAYALEVPLKRTDVGDHPGIRINIWGYPEFPKPKTIYFSGTEDAGGGPSRGEGCALFQANLNKSIPERLVGSVSFTSLQNNLPVSGTYEFSTLDGKTAFKGSFQAVWGNKPPKVIR